MRNLKIYKLAYENHVLFKQMSDTLVNQQNTRELAKMEAEYDFNQEKLAIEATQHEKELAFNNEKKVLLLWQAIIILGFSLVTLFALVLVRYYYLKNKSNLELKELNEQIKNQSEEIKQQNEVILVRNHLVRKTKGGATTQK